MEENCAGHLHIWVYPSLFLQSLAKFPVHQSTDEVFVLVVVLKWLLLPVYTIMILASTDLTISLVIIGFVSVWKLIIELCSIDSCRLYTISIFYILVSLKCFKLPNPQAPVLTSLTGAKVLLPGKQQRAQWSYYLRKLGPTDVVWIEEINLPFLTEASYFIILHHTSSYFIILHHTSTRPIVVFTQVVLKTATRPPGHRDPPGSTRWPWPSSGSSSSWWRVWWKQLGDPHGDLAQRAQRKCWSKPTITCMCNLYITCI